MQNALLALPRKGVVALTDHCQLARDFSAASLQAI